MTETGRYVDDDELHKTTGRSVIEHADDVDAGYDAGELIEKIEAVRVADSLDDIWTSDMMLPGFKETQDDCGEAHPYGCLGCGAWNVFGRTCYQSMCRRCAPSWARRQAKRKCAKLLAMRAYLDEVRDRHQRCHHVVISPPANWDPKGDPSWEKALDVVKAILDACDLEGQILYHPFKGKDGDDIGEWKTKLNSDRDWEDVYADLKFAPHFHCVVVGHKVPGGGTTRAVEAMTGWIIHRITKEDSNVSLYGEADLARAVTYCLSHTGIYETENGDHKAATRWVGSSQHDATADDADEAYMDAVVRSVAPKTLGLEYNDLACSEEHVSDEFRECDDDDHDHHEAVEIDPALAAGDPREGYHVAGGGGGGDDELNPSLDLPDAANLPDVVGSDVIQNGARDGEDDWLDLLEKRARLRGEELPTDRCNGRMADVGSFVALVRDDEWARQAEHAEQAVEMLNEWAEDLDYVDWDPATDPYELDWYDAGGAPEDADDQEAVDDDVDGDGSLDVDDVW